MDSIHIHSMQCAALRVHFGPAHPAAHGVLRSMMLLSGERILCLDISLGLLHRGTEYLCMSRGLIQCVQYDCGIKGWISARWMCTDVTGGWLVGFGLF